MYCERPHLETTTGYGCGQCPACRQNKAQIWKTRILLEASMHADNAFVTLTYNDLKLPMLSSTSYGAIPTLNPRDLQTFWKRLRHNLPTKLRYFAVGEYGDETWRPHYHAAVFNFPRCERGETLRNPITQRRLWNECCSTCRMVGETWGNGDIEVGVLDEGKCEYVGGYITKKLTKKDDPLLEGRFPEFSRQSRMPSRPGGPGGIGASALVAMGDVIRRYAPQSVDVPLVAMHGRKSMPLGRYMRRKLRAEIGLPEATPREAIEQAWQEKMLPMLLDAKNDPEAPSLGEQIRKKTKPYVERLKFQRSLRKRRKL